MNEEFSRKIMEQINADKITPLPRWRFLILRWSLMFSVIFSVMLGGLSVAATLFLFVDFHRHGLFAIPHDVVEFLGMVPFLWIAALGIFVILARISLKYTKKGYKYSTSAIVLVSVLLSIMLGLTLNLFGVGKITHELLNTVHAYNLVVQDSRKVWSHTEKGRLNGVVTSIEDNNNFSVIDSGGRVWKIRIATTTDEPFSPKKDSDIRMSGLLESSTSIFIAQSVHEWEL